MPGEIVFGAPATNVTVFAPVPLDTNEQMYFRAHYADATISIAVLQSNAYEPHLDFPDQWGIFSLTSTGTNDVSVLYRLSGTASNGVDYTNLSGVVTIPASLGHAEILVQPLSDLNPESLETVTLALIPANTYLIDTNPPSATVFIHDDASTTVQILSKENAIEPDASSSVPRQDGFFILSRDDTRLEFPALTVTFKMSGVASNGVDYTNITGSVTFQPDNPNAIVLIQPVDDGILEGDETVRLTLLPGTNYNVSISNREDAILIEEHPTNIFVTVVTNLDLPVGIDYLAVSNSLVVSCNFLNIQNQTGGHGWTNFVRIYTNQTPSNVVTVVKNWSTVSNVANEVKLVTIKTNADGFTNGDMYFGSDNGIGWLSASGATNNLNWCVLTNVAVSNVMLLRGSICQDHTGIFSNQLICVTSGGQEGTTRDVWRVDAQAHPTLIAQIETSHLEGVITLPNDTNKWGPWAGKIITGDESLFPSPVIYTIDPNGTVATYDTTLLFPDGIHPEDFDIIPPNQDLYACAPGEGTIVKLSASYLTNYVGDLLITDAGEFGPSFPSGKVGARLFILHWDASLNNFIIRRISYRSASNGNLGSFEHVTFAPIHLPSI